MTESQGTDNAWEAYQQDAAEAAASLAAVAGGAAAASGEQPESDFNSEGGSDGEVPPTPATKPAPAPSKRKQGRPRKHPPPKTPKMSHDEKWQERIEGLRAFKEWHGHTNVSRAQDKELGRFVNSQREYYKKLLEGKSSSLTPERIADLEDLGFQWTLRSEAFTKSLAKISNGEKPSRARLQELAKANLEKMADKRQSKEKDDLAWNSYLEKLKIFKQTSGHLRVPFDDNRPRKNPRAAYDPETLQLGKWVKRQRRQYALKQLSQDRIEALEKIGFSFNPGNPTKEEKIEIQLGLLDSLRKRPELTKVQVADLDFVYDQWKGRAKERAPKPIGAARGENKFDAKWTAMFEQLKEFRVENGHTRVPQSQKVLGKWVDYQRGCYWKRQRGEKSPMNDDRIAQLERIGFEWRIRSAMPMKSPGTGDEGVPVKSGEVTGNDAGLDVSFIFTGHKDVEAGDNMHDHVWNRYFNELSRYRQVFGTTSVAKGSHPEYAAQLASLAGWCDRQRTAYKKLKKGEKGGLSTHRLNRLQEINFEFDRKGKSIDFRGWDAKLSELKAFRERNGHCRVPLRRKKKDDPNFDEGLRKLAKWVEHQRTNYWKRAKGEQNSLSDERIAALNAIGFEWRVVKDHRFAAGNEMLTPPNANSAGAAGMKNELDAATQLIDYSIC